MLQRCKLYIRSLLKLKISNKERFELTRSKKKLLKKMDETIEHLDNQINNSDGMDENKLTELTEQKDKLENLKKDVKKRSIDPFLPY